MLWPLRISEQALCHTVPCVVGGDRRSSTQTFHGVHMHLIGQARRDRVSGLSVFFSKLSYVFTQDTHIHTTIHTSFLAIVLNTGNTHVLASTPLFRGAACTCAEKGQR